MAVEAAIEIAVHTSGESLTPREVDVLRLVEQGKAKEITKELCLSEQTIKARIKNILATLGADDRIHAPLRVALL